MLFRSSFSSRQGSLLLATASALVKTTASVFFLFCQLLCSLCCCRCVCLSVSFSISVSLVLQSCHPLCEISRVLFLGACFLHFSLDMILCVCVLDFVSGSLGRAEFFLYESLWDSMRCVCYFIFWVHIFVYWSGFFEFQMVTWDDLRFAWGVDKYLLLHKALLQFLQGLGFTISYFFCPFFFMLSACKRICAFLYWEVQEVKTLPEFQKKIFHNNLSSTHLSMTTLETYMSSTPGVAKETLSHVCLQATLT